MANPILPRRSRDLVLYPTGPVPVELCNTTAKRITVSVETNYTLRTRTQFPLNSMTQTSSPASMKVPSVTTST